MHCMLKPSNFRACAAALAVNPPHLPPQPPFGLVPRGQGILHFSQPVQDTGEHPDPH